MNGLIPRIIFAGVMAVGFVSVQLSGAEKEQPSAAAKSASTAKVNINTADQATLQLLPGVGPELARAIIDVRPFRTVDDLEWVEGIGESRLIALREIVTVGVEPPAVKGKTLNEKTGGPIPTRSSKGAGSQRGEKENAAETKRVNINTANAALLATLPGVGEATARWIIAARPFRDVEDLVRVAGIGETKMAELRDMITVGSPRQHVLRPGQKVNINTATHDQLIALPGIGSVKSQAIIDARPFSAKEDVMKVKGIKEETYQEIKDWITVR